MRAFIRGLGLTACLMVAATTACTSASDDVGENEGAATAAQIASAFDVNDVSILFPFKGTFPYPAIRVSGVAEDGQDQAPADQQLWTKEVFEQVVAEAKRQKIAAATAPQFDFFKLRGLWHIVGMRFDPCAPGFEDSVLAAQPQATKGKCIIQMRLIAQPLVDQDTADFTAHLVYNLGVVPKSELASHPVVKKATDALGAIKQASDELKGGKTAGQPLGVHPGLAAEAKAGGTKLAGLLKSFIKDFAATPSRSIAFMGLQNGGPEPWTFFGGKVENNKFTIEPGPIHGKKSQSLDFISGDGPVNPKSTAKISTTPLFTSLDNLSEEQKKLAFGVEDPKTTSFFTTDCVSCHTSSARTHDLGLGSGPEMASRVRVPKNVTGYVTKAFAQDDAWNVRNFGYFGNKATVSGRTVTETVEVVEWLNKNVRAPGAGINGPGPDCTDVDDKVWLCFRDGKKDCLKACKPGPAPTEDVPAPAPVRVDINPADPANAKDPCVTATVGGEPSVEVFNSAGLSGAKIGGNNSACLTRVMGGAFATKDLTIACPMARGAGGNCVITVADDAGAPVDKVSITGEELARFRQFFRAKDGVFFQSRGGQGGVQIACSADACTVSVAGDRSQLPAQEGMTRVNPE